MLQLLQHRFYSLLNRPGRHHAGEVVGQLAVFEEEDGGQSADTHLVGNVFGLLDVNAVEAHSVLKITGELLNDGIHDGALAQPIGSENNKKRVPVCVPQQLVESLLANCWVCYGFIQIRDIN